MSDGVLVPRDDLRRIARVVRSVEALEIRADDDRSQAGEFARGILLDDWSAISESDRDFSWAAITRACNLPCWLLRSTEAIDTEEPRQWQLTIDSVDLPLLDEGISARDLQKAIVGAGHRGAQVAGYGYFVGQNRQEFSRPIYSVIIPGASEIAINGDEVSEGRCQIEVIASRWQITGSAIRVNTLWPLSTDLYCGQAVFCRAWAGVGWVLLSSECWEPS